MPSADLMQVKVTKRGATMAGEEVSTWEDVSKRHLEWSKTQGYILTGGGKAESYYTAERGFPFEEHELPHYHLSRGATTVFGEWTKTKDPCQIVAGVWNRPLFAGGWKHTTEADELVYNVQTYNLFVDLRIPTSRKLSLESSGSEVNSMDALTPEQLRVYARQHVFAGFSVFSRQDGKHFCTRHHCIDWNYVGTPRTRPNKWWIELNEDKTQWKEHSWAKDDHGHSYYFERWQRAIGNTTLPRLALRKSGQHTRDGILVVVGDHFNYVLARDLTGNETRYPEQKSLVELVDAAIEAGDLTTARSYLSIEAGHGRVSDGFKLDLAIPPWNEGKPLWNKDEIKLEGDSLQSFHFIWRNEKWELYDCSFGTLAELKHFFHGKRSSSEPPAVDTSSHPSKVARLES